MPASHLKLLAAACLSAAALAALPCAAQDQAQAIVIDADSSEIDYLNNTQVLHNPRVTHGDVIVRADLAKGRSDLEVEDSAWEFIGNVIITTARGHLRADRADVVFRDSRIVTATIMGSDPGSGPGNGAGAPASFEQKLDDPDRVASGHAGTIEYDVAAETVRLQGNAWLTDGRNDIRGDTLQFNIRDQKVVANPAEQGKDRVRITINPKAPRPQEDPPPP